MNDTIKINGKTYKAVNADSTKKQILVLQRGWVIVGDVTKKGDYLTVTNCSIIRVWGTTEGLGEIALNGPTAKTKLDPCGDITVHVLTTVMVMDINAEKWA